MEKEKWELFYCIEVYFFLEKFIIEEDIKVWLEVVVEEVKVVYVFLKELCEGIIFDYIYDYIYEKLFVDLVR